MKIKKMLKVKPTWLIRSKLHKQANILFQCSSTNSKDDDKLKMEIDLKVTKNGKNSAKIHYTRKEIPNSENFLNKKNEALKIRRRSLSPGERVASLLSEEERTNDDDIKQSQQSKDINKSKSNASEDKDENQVRQNNDFMKQRFKARLKIQPSKRLASMLPENYWQSLDDSETKTIVEDLGDSVNTDSNKGPEK